MIPLKFTIGPTLGWFAFAITTGKVQQAFSLLGAVFATAAFFVLCLNQLIIIQRRDK